MTEEAMGYGTWTCYHAILDSCLTEHVMWTPQSMRCGLCASEPLQGTHHWPQPYMMESLASKATRDAPSPPYMMESLASKATRDADIA